MQCTRPVYVLDDEGFMAVPCGKCVMCKIAKQREWALRVQHELPYHAGAVFATLTYRDEDLPPDLALHKQVFRAFVKRLRAALEPRRMRYLGCGEYGDPREVSESDPRKALWVARGFARPHYHAILFGVTLDEHELRLVDPRRTEPGWKSLRGPVNDAWGYGYVVLGSVTYNSAAYVIRYMEKKFDKAENRRVYGALQAPFQLQSQGLGRQYALDNRERLVQDLGVRVKGKPVGLPRYYQKILLTADSDKARLYAKAEQAELDGRFYWARKGVHEAWEQKKMISRGRLQVERDAVGRLKEKDGRRAAVPRSVGP